MKVAMAQINSIVGDLKGNATKIMDFMAKAKTLGADLVIFPELAVTGYPPQDLLYEKDFITGNIDMLNKIAQQNPGIVTVLGYVDRKGKSDLHNAAAVIQENRIIKTVHKTHLPTYDVFDEARYFKPSRLEHIQPIEIEIKKRKISLGVEICEDLWDQDYEIKVTDILAKNGADLIINISASPFYTGKLFIRENHLRTKAISNRTPIFYVNMVGGQDELVFDGQSIAVDAEGNLLAIARQFDEDLTVTSIDPKTWIGKRIESPSYNKEKELFNALVLGIRDYFRKTGFRKAVVGMSGGIDSSLTTCIAVEALGNDNVIGVSMPSKFSSEHSKKDAQKLAENLGICFVKFSIRDIVECYSKTLEDPLKQIREHFKIEKDGDNPVADENIQPRVRGNSLMDFSNRLWDLKILVLNTGNKTEIALGYCTLYGDMAGGIGVLGDVSKLQVYNLAEYVNERMGKETIPKSVFTKKPSPELKETQFDPFDFSIVSPMVDEIIENRKSKRELVEMGYPEDVVTNIFKRFRNAEHKRRQAPPCIKITQKAFGIGWKMPIVNKYTG